MQKTKKKLNFHPSDKKEEKVAVPGKSWEEEQKEKEEERRKREEEAWEREQRELEMLQGKSPPVSSGFNSILRMLYSCY